MQVTFVRAVLVTCWDVSCFRVGSRKMEGEIFEIVSINESFKEFCYKGKEKTVGSR